MHVGIPPIFCKFQFSSQAIHSTLLEKKKKKKENGVKTKKHPIASIFCFSKGFVQLCRIYTQLPELGQFSISEDHISLKIRMFLHHSSSSQQNQTQQC